MTHTLRIEQTNTHNSSATPDDNGNYPIDLLRKRLYDAEIGNPLLRTNPSSPYQVQRTNDGGATWVDSIGDDPRYSPTLKLPPRAASGSRQCDAAANMVDKLKGFVDEIIGAANTAAAATGFLGIAARFIPEIGVIAEIILDVVGGLLAIGASTLNSTMTTTVYDGIQNALFCVLEPDGSITASSLAAARAVIGDNYGSTVLSIFDYLMTATGEVGLSNAGATGDVVGDCSGSVCQFIHTFDFLASNGGWQLYTAGHGNWVNAYGWGVTGANTVDIKAGLAARNIDRIKVTFSATNQDGGRPSVITYLTASQVERIDSSKAAGANSTHETLIYNFAGGNADLIRIALIGNNAVTWIESVEIKGHGGSDPF